MSLSQNFLLNRHNVEIIALIIRKCSYIKSERLFTFVGLRQVKGYCLEVDNTSVLKSLSFYICYEPIASFSLPLFIWSHLEK